MFGLFGLRKLGYIGWILIEQWFKLSDSKLFAAVPLARSHCELPIVFVIL